MDCKWGVGEDCGVCWRGDSSGDAAGDGVDEQDAGDIAVVRRVLTRKLLYAASSSGYGAASTSLLTNFPTSSYPTAEDVDGNYYVQAKTLGTRP